RYRDGQAMSQPRGGKSRANRDAPVMAETPTVESHGLGAVAAAAPLGLDDPLPWEAIHPHAPVTRSLEAHTPTAESLSAFEKVPTSIGRRSLARPLSATASHAAIHGAIGPAPTTPAPTAKPPAAEAKKPSAASFIRDRLSPDGLSEIKAMMFDPKLALTVAQRDILGRIGRYAELGDKAGIKRSVMDLVDRPDVTSPHHAA